MIRFDVIAEDPPSPKVLLSHFIVTVQLIGIPKYSKLQDCEELRIFSVTGSCWKIEKNPPPSYSLLVPCSTYHVLKISKIYEKNMIFCAMTMHGVISFRSSFLFDLFQ